MASSKRASKRVRPACGTWLEITLPAPDAGLHAAAFREAARLERILSAHDPEGELARVNEGAVPVSAELREVLARGTAIETASRGTFRMRGTDGRYDLGGIAKGYLVDRVFELVAGRTRGPVLVNAGGDLRARGAHEIEVRVPTASGDERRYRARIEDAAMATSSRLATAVGRASARYSLPPGTTATACVIASEAVLADAVTKVALFSEVSEVFLAGVHAVLAFDERGEQRA